MTGQSQPRDGSGSLGSVARAEALGDGAGGEDHPMQAPKQPPTPSPPLQQLPRRFPLDARNLVRPDDPSREQRYCNSFATSAVQATFRNTGPGRRAVAGGVIRLEPLELFPRKVT